MHDTRTIFGGDIVTGDDAISSLSRIDTLISLTLCLCERSSAFAALRIAVSFATTRYSSRLTELVIVRLS